MMNFVAYLSLNQLRITTRRLTCLILLVALSIGSTPNSVEGQGIVTVNFSNRGDWSITGDNLSNSVVVSELGDDVLIEGLDGTLILRNVPGLPVETATSTTIPKSILFLPRNVTIDLKQGDNSIIMFYMPELITGSLTGKLGSGENIFGLIPDEEVEILNGINIRGSRSSRPQYVVVGNFFANQEFIYCRRDISIDLKGSDNVAWLSQTICDRNLAIKTAGNSSEVQCVSVGVMGKADLRISPSVVSQTALGFSYFAGKTTLSMGNGNNELNMTGINCDGEVVAKFGRGNDRLYVDSSVFNHPKGAKFDGGRGENLYGELFNTSVVPLSFKNFSIFP